MVDYPRLPSSTRQPSSIGLLAASTVLVLVALLVHTTQRYAQAEEANAHEAEQPKQVNEPSLSTTRNAPAVDSLGDPLPAGARLRFGTSRFHPPSGAHEIGLSGDEKSVVTVGQQIMVWDAATGKERWRTDTNEMGFSIPGACYGVRALAFSSDGTKFYTPGKANEIVVWDTLSGQHEILRINSEKLPVNMEQRSCRSVDVTPDGNTLALGNSLGLVVCNRSGEVLYELANDPGAPIKFDDNDRLAFGGHSSLGRFSPDGTLLAVVTSGNPKVIGLFESREKKEVRRIQLNSRLVRLAFSPDGRQIATTERDSAVRLYEVDTGKEIWSQVIKLTNPYENYTSAIAFAPDGLTVAAGATDHRLYVLDAKTGEVKSQLSGHTWYPWALAFTSDSKALYSSGWDGWVRRWDLSAGKQLALPQGIRATSIVAASPDGRTLAYHDDQGTIHLTNARDGAEQQTLALPGTTYTELVFSPDGKRLAGGGKSGENVHVAVWELPSGKLAHRWDWPKGWDPHSEVESLRFAPDGKRLAAAVFRQSAAYVWDLTTGLQTTKLAHGEVYGLSFSPDGNTLATAGWDSILRFWEPENGKLLKEINVKEGAKDGEDRRMYTVCYAPEGDLIATAHLDGTVRIWQADEMTLRTTFRVKDRFVYGAMSFSPDGLWLATGAMNGDVTLWDPLTGKVVRDVGRHQHHVYAVGFGRDSQILVSGGEDGLCYQWDLRPPGPLPEKDMALLWNDLGGDNSLAAYEAMWTLAKSPERAISMLGEKLRSIRTVLDLDHVTEGQSAEEAERLRSQKLRLIAKKAELGRSLTVRRAVTLLAQLGTPDAIALLKELGDQEANREVGRYAKAALDRLGVQNAP